MSDEQVRVFVAIELPDEVRNHLARIEKELQATVLTGVRWMKPEGIHLTLKFLGNVPVSLLPRIESAVHVGCQNIDPFSLRPTALGVFPGKNRARVLWVGVGGEVETLARLQSGVDAALEKLGFSRESRAYAAHLTLGRVQETAPLVLRRKIGDLVDAVKVDPLDSFRVGSVSIMQSKLIPGGAIYSRLASIDL